MAPSGPFNFGEENVTRSGDHTELAPAKSDVPGTCDPYRTVTFTYIPPLPSPTDTAVSTVALTEQRRRSPEYSSHVFGTR